MPVFKVAEAVIKGEILPPNVGYDAVGSPTQAPKEILESGALMTFDRGPKSSGLALMVELFANALTGGCLPGDPENRNWGNLAFAIDSDLLIGRESFLKNVDRTIAHIKGLRRTDPARDIHLPGELSFIRAEQAVATQELEIDEQLFRAYRERVLSPLT
jgi:LDH2 family malate/lactate/ureidoglycolate dehydrogenase